MNAAQLLETLRADGLTVAAVGDRFTVTPARRLTDAHRAAMREHRGELLALLAGNLHLFEPADWPLDAARHELARLRQLRVELKAASVPAWSLACCDDEIACFETACRRCEGCRHRDTKPDAPGCRVLHLGSRDEPARTWLAEAARPNRCEHFEAQR